MSVESELKGPVLLIGSGEVGSTLSRGLLRSGYPVYHVSRTRDFAQEISKVPVPVLALVVVPKGDLHQTLQMVPHRWNDRIGLTQDELLPQDWEAHDIDSPTVLSVWFEKLRGLDISSILPSPVFGPKASIIEEALGSLNIPYRRLASPEEMLFELVFDYMENTLGSRELARRFFPLIMSIFLFIFAANLFEFLPFSNALGFVHGDDFVHLFRPAATDLNVTLALAIISYFVIEVTGVVILGFLRYSSLSDPNKTFAFTKSPNINIVVASATTTS